MIRIPYPITEEIARALVDYRGQAALSEERAHVPIAAIVEQVNRGEVLLAMQSGVYLLARAVVWRGRPTLQIDECFAETDAGWFEMRAWVAQACQYLGLSRVIAASWDDTQTRQLARAFGLRGEMAMLGADAAQLFGEEPAAMPVDAATEAPTAADERNARKAAADAHLAQLEAAITEPSTRRNGTVTQRRTGRGVRELTQ